MIIPVDLTDLTYNNYIKKAAAAYTMYPPCIAAAALDKYIILFITS